jgi:uncharacterized protein YegJ (DUF2314 family)
MKCNNWQKMNVITICSSHTEERKQEMKKNLPFALSMLETKLNKGEKTYAQFDFNQDGFEGENMWLDVSSIDHSNKTITGTLDNVPHYLTNIKYGDVVQLSFDDLLNVLR